MGTNLEAGRESTGKFVIYLRVSTAKQGAAGNGIDAQRQACFDHLNGGDWKVVGEFIEVESGRKNRRPQLEAALAQCVRDGATLLVAKLDRLSRNVSFVSRLLDSGVSFVAADMPMANNLTIHLIAAMAQHEAEQTSIRTKAALAVVKARGTKLGNPNAAEAAVDARAVRSANALFHAEKVFPVIEKIQSFGITTLRGIAAELTERKIETPARQAQIDKGKPPFGDPVWHPQQVKAIIDRVKGNREKLMTDIKIQDHGSIESAEGGVA